MLNFSSTCKENHKAITTLIDMFPMKTTSRSTKWRDALQARPWQSDKALGEEHKLCIIKKNSSAQLFEFEDQLPPPQPFPLQSASRQKHILPNHPFLSDIRVRVSSNRPFRILSASSDVQAFLGFLPAEMCGRCFTILHGPSTDSVSCTAALKAAADRVRTILPLVLYSRDGSERRVIAEISPVDDEGQDSARSILVRLTANGIDTACDAVVRRSMRCASRRRSDDEALRHRYRSQYAFRTGLGIQRAMQHHAGAADRCGA